jgi:CMP/dCMP kinase
VWTARYRPARMTGAPDPPTSNHRLIVTIDGPAGGGKSTTARLVARALGYLYIDSGAMYRALALAVERAGVDAADDAGIARVVHATEVRLVQADGDEGVRVLIDGDDVTARLRTADVDRIASRVAALPAVRARLVTLQRQLGAQGGVVMEGRDIGTVVFPHADVKVYLSADLRVRAERRQRQRGASVIDQAALEAVMHDLHARDDLDRHRTESPLRIPEGAIIVDTSECTIPEQVEAVLAAVRATHAPSA